MSIPDGCVLEVSLEKVTGYLLNPDHADGRPKALFFLSNGLNRNDPEPFIALLHTHFETCANPTIRNQVCGGGQADHAQRNHPSAAKRLDQRTWEKIIKFVTAYKI
jgi:hypothetical protein